MRLPLILAMFLTSATVNAQWTIQDSHTTADLRGIHSLGNGIAWASGTNGTVLRTTDDGATWQTCTTPPDADKLDFRGIQAFDANIAIVMSSGKGDLSRLYKTTDACKTWKLLFTNPDKDGFWDGIQGGFERESGKFDGVLVGDPVDGKFAIYTQISFHTSWEPWNGSNCLAPKCRDAKANRNESIFAASNSAMVSPGSDGDLAFVTGGPGGARLVYAQPHGIDGISSFAFSTIKLPIPSGENTGAFSIARHGKDPDGINANFMVVGGDYRKPDSPGTSVYITIPTSWFFLTPHTVKPIIPPHGFRSAVTYDADQKTWITVGPNGTDVSTDDGRNWHALKPSTTDSPDADKNWNALSLPFVVGPKGHIGRLRANALQ